MPPKKKTNQLKSNINKTDELLTVIENNETDKFPVILSFDVGVVHLAYCLMTKKKFNDSKIDWCILDWNNIDLTNRDEQKCHCGAKAKYSNIINNETKYYCGKHIKKLNTQEKDFDECFRKLSNKKDSCCYQIVSGSDFKICGKTASFQKIENNENCFCTTHAKQSHKQDSKSLQIKDFKIKSSTTLNFDDVKYSLMMELEKRKNLLEADYVVIENQPSFKNPRMKSIASTLYDYYLIRGLIDKSITNSNIKQVKFMSPSNKLKLANDGDTKQLIKAKNTDDTKAYKLTKSLGIKYCLDLTTHLEDWQRHFNSHKKKDDLADAFLQGAYFYTNTIELSKKDKKVKKNTNSEKSIDLIQEIKV